MELTLQQQMESEGWTFGYRCTAYMDCTMELHFKDPFDKPHAVKDYKALQRYFGTTSQRIEAMERAKQQSRETK